MHLTHFKTFESGVTTVKSDIMADARNRIADCYYITTKYPMAISYYDKVIDFGKVDADYAMYQKGFSLGLTNDQQGKDRGSDITYYRNIRHQHMSRMLFLKGEGLTVLEDYKKGEADFNTVINTYQSTPFVPRAMVQLGLLYFNLGENEKAIAQYKKVIETYQVDTRSPECNDRTEKYIC